MNEFNGEIKKMMIILSKATLENVYAAFVLANGARMEGIEAEMFFTFFGLEAIHKEKLEHLHIATVGNPAMHMPTLLGGLPGMEALATSMMKKEENRHAGCTRIFRYTGCFRCKTLGMQTCDGYVSL